MRQAVAKVIVHLLFSIIYHNVYCVTRVKAWNYYCCFSILFDSNYIIKMNYICITSMRDLHSALTDFHFSLVLWPNDD